MGEDWKTSEQPEVAQGQYCKRGQHSRNSSLRNELWLRWASLFGRKKLKTHTITTTATTTPIIQVIQFIPAIQASMDAVKSQVAQVILASRTDQSKHIKHDKQAAQTIPRGNKNLEAVELDIGIYKLDT